MRLRLASVDQRQLHCDDETAIRCVGRPHIASVRPDNALRNRKTQPCTARRCETLDFVKRQEDLFEAVRGDAWRRWSRIWIRATEAGATPRRCMLISTLVFGCVCRIAFRTGFSIALRTFAATPCIIKVAGELAVTEQPRCCASKSPVRCHHS